MRMEIGYTISVLWSKMIENSLKLLGIYSETSRLLNTFLAIKEEESNLFGATESII